MDWLIRTDVWVPLAIVLFGLLVMWGAVREVLARGRRERDAVKVSGKIIEFVSVQLPTETRPAAAAIVEYSRDGETKRFQTESLATYHGPVEPKGFGNVGDAVTVYVPSDGGEPWIGRQANNHGMFVGQMLMGLALIGCAFVVRLFLLH